jgi:phage shock protein A
MSKYGIDHLKSIDKLIQYVRFDENLQRQEFVMGLADQAAAELEQLKAENENLEKSYLNQIEATVTLEAEYDALRSELDEMREALEMALAEIYVRGVTASVAVAYVCDEKLDRSGALLGRIRERAAAVLAKYPAHPETKEEK